MKSVELPVTSQCIPVGIREVSHPVPLLSRYPDSVTMSSTPGKLANVHPAICVLKTASSLSDPLDMLASADLAGGADVAADPVHPVTLEPAL